MAKKVKYRDAPMHVGLKKPVDAKAEAANEAPVKPESAKKPDKKPAKPVEAQRKELAKKPAKSSAAKSVHSECKPLSNVAPTAQIAEQLQSAFDHFNTELFKGKLGPCVLKLDRLRKYVGYFHPKQWTTNRKAGWLDGSHHEIRLDPDRLRGDADKVVLSTLVHEMVHQLVFDAYFAEHGKIKRAYHDSEWCGAMQAIGLPPVILGKDGKPSGKPTGATATHSIEKGGVFDKSAEALLKTGFKLSWLLVPKKEREEKGDDEEGKSRQGVKVKYECPNDKCDVAAWGKPDMKITCTECDEPMRVAQKKGKK